MMRRHSLPAALALAMAPVLCAASEKTYAERLGWERGSRVLILHCDDGGERRERMRKRGEQREP